MVIDRSKDRLINYLEREQNLVEPRILTNDRLSLKSRQMLIVESRNSSDDLERASGSLDQIPDEYTYKTKELDEFDMFEEIPDEINQVSDEELDLFAVDIKQPNIPRNQAIDLTTENLHTCELVSGNEECTI